jgi:hypothetical protein
VDKVLKYCFPGVLAASAIGFIIWGDGAAAMQGDWIFLAAFVALAALVMG